MKNDEHEIKEKYLSIDDVIKITGMTRANLAQLRFMRQGPKYLKPSPRTVLYRQSDILQWLEDSEVKTEQP